jgi:hypothetical protein
MHMIVSFWNNFNSLKNEKITETLIIACKNEYNPNLLKWILAFGIGIPQCLESLEQGLGGLNLCKLGLIFQSLVRLWRVNIQSGVAFSYENNWSTSYGKIMAKSQVGCSIFDY